MEDDGFLCTRSSPPRVYTMVPFIGLKGLSNYGDKSGYKLGNWISITRYFQVIYVTAKDWVNMVFSGGLGGASCTLGRLGGTNWPKISSNLVNSVILFSSSCSHTWKKCIWYLARIYISCIIGFAFLFVFYHFSSFFFSFLFSL